MTSDNQFTPPDLSKPVPAAAPGADGPVIGQATQTVGSAAVDPYSAPQTSAYSNAATQAAQGPVGSIRGTGACIALALVTFGIYAIFWYYKVHTEMKEHTGAGLGGGVAALLAFFVGIVMPFLTSSEVGDLYKRAGMPEPVSGMTGLWYMPGMFIVVGPIVWFVKTNGALNSYWRSVGAV